MALRAESTPRQSMNYAPADLNPEKDLPKGFMDFLLPLHRQFTPRQQQLAARRARVLAASHRGQHPNYLPPSEATTKDWHIELPDWCADQRNQMTGPADDSGAHRQAAELRLAGRHARSRRFHGERVGEHSAGRRQHSRAYKYELGYYDKKRQKQVGVQKSKTVTWVRPRGLHLSQGGVIKNEIISASLFDLALLWYQLDPARAGA